VVFACFTITANDRALLLAFYIFQPTTLAQTACRRQVKKLFMKLCTKDDWASQTRLLLIGLQKMRIAGQPA